MKRAGGLSAKLQSRFAVVLAILLSTATAFAADDKEKKEDKKPEPPRVTAVVPLAISAGMTNQIRVRGNNLTNVTELRFTNDSFKPVIAIKSKGKADLPKDADAKKLGDSQIEIEVVPPASASIDTNHFVVISPDGTSEAKPLILFPQGTLIAEHEPNGGFKQAQAMRLGQTTCGVIKEGGDVDVFRFSGKRGQRVRIEVCAAAVDSSLDSTVSLLDEAGHLVASNDDVRDGRDSLLEATLPKDGNYLISLIDAHEKGGPLHVYLLSVRSDAAH